LITYWELDENMSDAERLAIVDKVNSSGLFPPKVVNIIRWDGTPDAWRTLLIESVSAADIFHTINVWRAAGAGFFKFTKTAPVFPMQENIPISAEMQKALSSS